jgi:3-deoxy-D-manno-octulosonate 8-phosphate phosphatase (KDO 8-P phosphatase)
MQIAGVSTCPADASEEIRAIARYISHLNGGRGCVRDVIEQVMKIQGRWMNDGAFHW